MSERIAWASMTPEERDLLIAEKVTGWTPPLCREVLNSVGEPHDTWSHLFGGRLCCAWCGYEAAPDAFDVDHVVDDSCISTDPPHYSQAMNAAWLVVEHITQPPNSRVAALQMANTRFAHWFDGAHLWSESAQEASQAICVAALRSLGCEVEVDPARPWQDL